MASIFWPMCAPVSTTRLNCGPGMDMRAVALAHGYIANAFLRRRTGVSIHSQNRMLVRFVPSFMTFLTHRAAATDAASLQGGI